MNTSPTAFQDLIEENHCFGCGPENAQGLKIKSYWDGDNRSVCRFIPRFHHCAGPEKYLNGGIISTIIDCHCICTAMARAYEMAGRRIGEGDRIWFATGELNVIFKKPVPIDKEVLLVASIETVSEKKITLSCTASSDGEDCAEGRVIAVRVPNSWFDGQ